MDMNELKKRMEDEGFNRNAYHIGDGWLCNADCDCLDKVGTVFEIFYVERGQKRKTLQTFTSEEEACKYYYKNISSNIRAKAHNIGFFKDKEKAVQLCSVLERHGILFESDHFQNNGPNDIYYRVTVFGTDAEKAKTIAIENGFKNYSISTQKTSSLINRVIKFLVYILLFPIVFVYVLIWSLKNYRSIRKTWKKE